MKKVLVIAPYPYLPFFSGGQKFIAQFLHYLGKTTDLSVISVEGNDASLATTYRILPLLKKSFSRYLDTSLISKITAEVKANGYDTVIWEHPYYAWLAIRVKKRTGVRTIIQTHNIEYQRFRSTGKWWWPLLKMYEKWAFRKADNLFFITKEDKDFAINNWNIATIKCIDLPFGVEITRHPDDKAASRNKLLQQHGIAPQNKIIFFNGLLKYKPNLDALKVILDKVNPLLMQQNGFAYKIIVCGKGLPAEMNNLAAYKDKNIIYAGFVEDIDTYFKGADIFLNPVQSGGGIKTKMVESIAFGTTVVATATGAAGMEQAVCGEKLKVVPDDDWGALAQAIFSHIHDATITPESFYNIYYWENIIQRIRTSLP